MQLFHLHARRRRTQVILFTLILGLGWLCVTFFQTQVLKTTAFALQSDANRLRPLPVLAPRGAIFDRHGEIVAENVPGYVLSLLPASGDSIRAKLEQIAPLLGLQEAQVERLLVRRRQAVGQPLIVASNLTFDQLAALEELRAFLPGIVIEMQPKRHYPAGAVIGHLVGHVGEVDEAELARAEFSEYVPGQAIGKSGLERQYETILAGRPGTRYVEVDALGRIVGELQTRRLVEPVPGQDIHLSLDLDLQSWVARIFPDSMRGALVAIEPRTGEVLAMYSNPGYDPNDFVGGIAADLWRQLNTDAAKPLLHRAATGLYPPGSTFKIFTAALGLELGVVNPLEVMPIPCRGGMQYGDRYFRCWNRAGHGSLDMAGAIQHSCNVYFYQLGLKIGLDRLLTEATRLGFSTATGVDLPVEQRGNFPDSPEWYRRRFGWLPTQTEVLSLAIGQGANDQTALKIAEFFAALAGGGMVPAPRLARHAPLVEGINLQIAPAHLAVLREGLRRVTGPGGTAYLSSLEHWDFIGKSGTSQNPHGKDHGWFAAMAGPKGGEPEIALAAIVEFGEKGSTTAQYVAKAADYYLRRKHGMSPDTIQTLREHLLAGRPAPWAR
jgi:penicillin-binding protein 2